MRYINSRFTYLLFLLTFHSMQPNNYNVQVKVKVEYEAEHFMKHPLVKKPHCRYGTHCRGISQLYLHTDVFIHEENEPYLPLPSQPKLVVIRQPGRVEG